MNPKEIQEAAKEADMTVFVMESVQRFAAIIEKRTIERCAVVAEEATCECCWSEEARVASDECAAAIRKLGEQ